jgi:hypothetical protein
MYYTLIVFPPLACMIIALPFPMQSHLADYQPGSDALEHLFTNTEACCTFLFFRFVQPPLALEELGGQIERLKGSEPIHSSRHQPLAVAHY